MRIPWLNKALVGMMVLLLSACAPVTPVPQPGSEPAVPTPPPPRTGTPYTVHGVTYYPLLSAEGYVAQGVASWYGPGFHGKRTASSEPFDMYRISAAHTILPLPSTIRATNLENGRQLLVRVNDRGPFTGGRLVDFSYGAARELGFDHKGTTRVRIEAVTDPGDQVIMTAAVTASAAGSKPVDPVQTRVQIFVQLGAFSASHNASHQAERINRMKTGHQVRVFRVNVDKKQYYRVRLGPFKSVDVADATLSLLAGKGLGPARIVVE
ncbi:MAG: septal ring lytic transglycosylase RlpA family protein [Magnetococcales bacterium]|nr:septal ring lytic transglycosylase RlpA family protein [Magnetococcales bacterium]